MLKMRVLGVLGGILAAVVVAGDCKAGLAQTVKAAAADTTKQVYVAIPGFDATSIDAAVDPCNDFYKFACGKFAGNHPIPADQPEVDQFYALYNVNTQSLNGILDKAEAGGAGRSPDDVSREREAARPSGCALHHAAHHRGGTGARVGGVRAGARGGDAALAGDPVADSDGGAGCGAEGVFDRAGARWGIGCIRSSRWRC